MYQLDDSVLWLIVAAVVVSMLQLLRAQTTFMGWTLLFVFNVSSASLAAFTFGRLFGLDEAWITPNHAFVFRYSAWAVLAMVLAMGLAWRPSNRKQVNVQTRGQWTEAGLAWVNETFVYSSLALGVAASLMYFQVARVPTAGTVVAVFSNWTKFAVILAAIHWRLGRGLKPLIVSMVVYLPLALVSSVISGFSPVSTDLAIPLVLVLAGFRKFNLFSVMKVAIAGILLAHLMFSWMASRGTIRRGELAQYSIPERVEKLLGELADNIRLSNLNAFSTQSLILERIDMSQLLAWQVGYQPDLQPYRYGGTFLDGAFALVPRALWPSKPRVAGGSSFVSRYTGMIRPESDETSVGVPIQLELYANGGMAWVIVGLSLLVYLCARLERYVLVGNVSLRVLLPSIMVLMAFGSGIQQLMLVMASIAAGASSIYLLARVIESMAPRYHAKLMGRAAMPAPGKRMPRRAQMVAAPSSGLR